MVHAAKRSEARRRRRGSSRREVQGARQRQESCGNGAVTVREKKVKALKGRRVVNALVRAQDGLQKLVEFFTVFVAQRQRQKRRRR